MFENPTWRVLFWRPPRYHSLFETIMLFLPCSQTWLLAAPSTSPVPWRPHIPASHGATASVQGPAGSGAVDPTVWGPIGERKLMKSHSIRIIALYQRCKAWKGIVTNNFIFGLIFAKFAAYVSTWFPFVTTSKSSLNQGCEVGPIHLNTILFETYTNLWCVGSSGDNLLWVHGSPVL